MGRLVLTLQLDPGGTIVASHPFQITAWHKSSYSLNEDSFCLETARFTLNRTGVRDSKVPNGPVLLLTSPQWHTFVDHIKGQPAAQCSDHIGSPGRWSWRLDGR